MMQCICQNINVIFTCDIQLLYMCVSQEFLELKVLLEAGSLVIFLRTSYFIQIN